MLTARNLQCSRGRRRVLDAIDIDLPAGQVLGVLGANGAGKSTLLGTLAGELTPEPGLLLNGREMAAWSVASLARCRAVLPQSPGLGFDLPARDVVAMGAYPFPELAPRAYQSLSGGEQQRVQFARTLVQVLACRAADEYRVLFLDEPTSSLDPRHQLLLLQAVRALSRTDGLAVLVVLHDVNLAARWCDRLLLLADGRTVALGAPADVLSPVHLATVYGMEATVIDSPVHPGTPMVVFG